MPPISALVVFALFAILTIALFAPAQAQDGTAAEPLQESLVEVDDLEVQLLPLRRDELAAAAEEWISRLRDKVQALSSVEIAARQSTDADEKLSLQARAAELRTERSALIDRVDVVLRALKEKGGDTEEFEQYVDAVSGIVLDVTDTSAAWINIRTWLESPEGGIKLGLNIIKFIVTLVAFWILAIVVSNLVRKALRRVKQSTDLLREFLTGLARKTIIVVGAVVAVSMLGVNISPLIAAIGAAGLVIGFALQGTLSNFASGIMILIYRPYDVGDFVNVASTAGKVESMTLVSTTVITPDNQRIIVPNNSVWGGIITNVTGQSTRRVDMKFGISYSDDIDRAKAVLEDILKAQSLILSDPAPVIQVHELADSSVNIIVRPWVNTSDYWTVFWDVTSDVKRRFDKEGIGIPFPQMDVHLHNTAAAE